MGREPGAGLYLWSPGEASARLVEAGDTLAARSSQDDIRRPDGSARVVATSSRFEYHPGAGTVMCGLPGREYLRHIGVGNYMLEINRGMRGKVAKHRAMDLAFAQREVVDAQVNDQTRDRAISRLSS